jgi:hypothetical protein
VQNEGSSDGCGVARIGRLVALAAAVGLGLPACGQSRPTMPALTVAIQAGTVQARVGQKLTFDIAENESIGSAWTVSQQPDPNILRYLGPRTTRGCKAPGCDTVFSEDFQSVRAGTASVVFEYSFRGRRDYDPFHLGSDHPVTVSVIVG